MLCKSGTEKAQSCWRMGLVMLCASAAPTWATTIPAVETMSPVEALGRRCAPDLSPRTLALMIRQESAGVPWAVHVNGRYRLPRAPASMAEAAATVRWLADHGHDFDIGLLQVNSRTITRLGLSPAAVLEPCRNLHVASHVLHDCYSAQPPSGTAQDRLRHALSCYNTGSPVRGLRNGYVAGLLALAAQHDSTPETLMIPALEAPPPADGGRTRPTSIAPPTTDGPQDSPRGRDAFTQAPEDVFTPPPHPPAPAPAQ